MKNTTPLFALLPPRVAACVRLLRRSGGGRSLQENCSRSTGSVCLPSYLTWCSIKFCDDLRLHHSRTTFFLNRRLKATPSVPKTLSRHFSALRFGVTLIHKFMFLPPLSHCYTSTLKVISIQIFLPSFLSFPSAFMIHIPPLS